MSITAIEELEWPDRNADEVLDYLWDLSDDLIAASGSTPAETITAASANIMPSGSGEMTIAGHSPPVYAQNNGVVVWLTGGVPGRIYIVRMTANTDQGRTYEGLITIRVNSVLAATPIADPPSMDFGTPVTWP